MKNQSNKSLTSFGNHLTEQYGERCTPTREKFEKGFKKFNREALQPNLSTKKPR